MLVRCRRRRVRMGWVCRRVRLAADDLASCWCCWRETVVPPGCDRVVKRRRIAVRCFQMLFESAWLSCGTCAEHGRAERASGPWVVLLAVRRGARAVLTGAHCSQSALHPSPRYPAALVLPISAKGKTRVLRAKAARGLVMFTVPRSRAGGDFDPHPEYRL
jgi:hypothetical protein